MKKTPVDHFDRQYQTHLKHLKLKGLQPKTIEAYSRAIRRVGEHFDYQIDTLSEEQLTNYFTDLVDSHSWSTVKLDLYGLKFYYAHVLRKPWVAPGWYKRSGGVRCYTWVKNRLQEARLVPKVEKRGVHRKRRERCALPGMMIHQDGSTHEWVVGQKWDLIVIMDDATSEHYSMFFVEEEGTASSFRGVRDVIEARGLFSSFYSDRGSHYWHTPEAGGKVDRENPTQFGRAMKQLGIEMIAAYSPAARGRSERAFGTHQGRLPQELALAGITSMAQANQYLTQVYLSAFNAEFSLPGMVEGSAFVPWIGGSLDDILCEHYERMVGADNCVRFESLILQIPADQHRCHYVKARVRVNRYASGALALFHGPRGLAYFTPDGRPITYVMQQAA